MDKERREATRIFHDIGQPFSRMNIKKKRARKRKIPREERCEDLTNKGTRNDPCSSVKMRFKWLLEITPPRANFEMVLIYSLPKKSKKLNNS